MVNTSLLHRLLNFKMLDIIVSLLQCIVHSFFFFWNFKFALLFFPAFGISSTSLYLFDYEGKVLNVATSVREFNNIDTLVVFFDNLQDIKHFCLASFVHDGYVWVFLVHSDSDWFRVFIGDSHHYFDNAWERVDMDLVHLRRVRWNLSCQLVTWLKVVHELF